MNQIGIVMGSASDLPTMEEAAKILEKFGISFQMKISSAHRTLERTVNWVRDFENQGGQVIIAGAGMAAHLPGVIAGTTTLPVIGVPIRSGALEGVDALYAIVQMPPGIPVATVGINGAKNAGLLAIQILSATDPSLRQALKDYRAQMAADIEKKDQDLQLQLQKSLS